MTYRYCPDCEEWIPTENYTVDMSGETICPDHETALHGSLQSTGFRGFPLTENEFHTQNKHLRNPEPELEAAKRQGLVQ